MSWEQLATLAFFLVSAVATAAVRARRMARILEIDPVSRRERERVSLPPMAPLLDAPDVAARLLAPPEPLPRTEALFRDPAFDLPSFLEALRLDFERQATGKPLETLDRSAGASVGATRPVAVAVHASAEPVVRGAFADEQFVTVQVFFRALAERADDPAPRFLEEVWGIRRATDPPTWELLQILSSDTRSVEPTEGSGPATARYAPWGPTGDAEVPRERLDLMLAAVLERMSGATAPTDVLVPILGAELGFRAAVAAGAGVGLPELRGAIAEVRPGPLRREGALDVARVTVDGRIEAPSSWHFRETWVVVRDAEALGPWRLWRAEAQR